MGKRELLLVGVFIVLGAVVYQVTAPPADPARPGFSIGRLISEMRREVRGQRESAEDTRTTSIPVPASVTEVRVNLRSATITVTGEDRADIVADFHVRSSGYDKAEAERLVKESQLLVDEAGALIILSGKFPEAGRQTPTLTLKVPKRLGIRLDEKNGPLKVDSVGSVTVGPSTGETTITNIAGDVAVSQRGRIITIENVGGLRLTASANAEVKIGTVRGNTTLTLQSAEVRGESLGGGLEVESRNSDVRLEKLEKLSGSVRLNVNLGELTLSGIATDARMDGRRAEIRIEMAAAVPLAVYNDAEPVEVTLPKAGLRIDAVASDARISLDPALQEGGLKVDAPAETPGSPREERVTGVIAGGGPLVTLRNNRGDIVLRRR